MNTSQKKKPVLYIGLIAFLAIAVIGILYDFISKSGGIVAIISVVAAFLILAVALVIDTVSRKREAAKADDDDSFSAVQLPDTRFLRHTEDAGDDSGDTDYVWRPKTTPRSGFAGFSRRGFEEDSAPESSTDPSPAESVRKDFPVFNSHAAEAHSEPVPGSSVHFKAEAEPVFDGGDAFDDLGDDLIEDLRNIPEAAVIPTVTEQQPKASEQPAAEEDDLFRPVLKLTGTEQPQPEAVEPQPVPQPAPQPAPVVEETVPEQAVPAAAAVQPAAESAAPAAPVAPAAQPEPAAAAPVRATAAERRAAASVPAASVASSAVGGQMIESFYEGMSEEDILYRDCVEVWAADAKPAALRLIRYVDTIEDKQTAALIGRDVEYLNAMVDRISYFTELEYIDEMLEYRQHNYSTMVKDCLKRFSPFFMEKRLGLLWKGLDIEVMTDRRWFIFALTQVIFNAVEFTPNGGKIAISAKKHENYIDLTVEDSGKGISTDELPFIFMAGYMGDDAPNESGGRTGMGLFIAQSVMRKMGGEMLAESTPGKGTRITMRMPIIEPVIR